MQGNGPFGTEAGPPSQAVRRLEALPPCRKHQAADSLQLLCLKALASQGYDEQLGARSIINTVDSEVALPLVTQYLAAREEISEDDEGVLFHDHR